ncbi:MAG: type II toxin-antitoxin system PemK/MazF family toxin [Tepidiformaceae bacterium]
MAVGYTRFDLLLLNLDPTVGREIRKTRPYVVVSPDELNRFVRTLIVAPLTTTSKPYPTRIGCTFAGTAGFVVLDQLRTIDLVRCVRRLGHLDARTGDRILAVLGEMFAP